MEKLIKIPASMDKRSTSGKPLRAAAYCRVSTQRETQDSSIDLQEQYYTRLIDENPNWTNVGVFSERCTGLRRQDRAEFRAMMKLCRQGKIDLILTKSISRFGRNTLDSIQALRQLKEWNVDVYFEIGNLWLHEQQTEFVLTTLFAVAQAESASKSKNIKWGSNEDSRKAPPAMQTLCAMGTSVAMMDSLRLMSQTPKLSVRYFKCGPRGKALDPYPIGSLIEKSLLPAGESVGEERQSTSYSRMKNTLEMSCFRKHL